MARYKELNEQFKKKKDSIDNALENVDNDNNEK